MIFRKKGDKEFYEWLKKDKCYSIDKLITRNQSNKGFLRWKTEQKSNK